MISKKYLKMYYEAFLPLMECIFQNNTVRDQELVVNEQNLAIYFDVDRHIIKNFLKEMEDTGLAKYIGNKRLFDDFNVQFAMRCYKLIPTESKYCSTLQEFINSYMLWEPYMSDRIAFITNYTDALHDKKLKIAQQKVVEGLKLTKAEKKLLNKIEINLQYQKDYANYIELLKVINATRPEMFRSKYLAEGRNRETNILCNTMNPDKEHLSASEQDLSERYILLSTFFGTEDFFEDDTNGSIYRLSFALAHGYPLAHDIDVYATIWNKAFYKIECTSLIRHHLKVLCMPIFMSNGKKNAWNSIVAIKDNNLTRSEAARKVALNKLSEITGLSAREVMDKLSDAMRKFIGTSEFLEAEIFIHESNLHILMITEFMKRGIKTINVYDGFYFKNGTCDHDTFNEVYDLCTNQLIKNCK